MYYLVMLTVGVFHPLMNADVLPFYSLYESHLLLYCPFYDELRIQIINEMSVQKPEMFWSSDDDRIQWLFNFNVYKLATFVSGVCIWYLLCA